MTDPLHTFFEPRGVAVVGASSNPTKLSYGVLRNLATHGYRGPVYPVNPRGGEMQGLRVYRSVAELPDPVDLAVIVLSAERTAEALEACGQRGIRAAVLIASGFGELGAGGREREAQLREVARRYGMRFIGPNCVGVVDTYAPIDTTFIRTMPDQGVIGFVSHSGAVCGGTMDWASAVGVGFSRILSLGNQVDVDVADALDSLAVDPHTRVVAAYIEGLPDGRRFVEAAARLTLCKPLVVLKAGRTPSGTRAVASHTGALAGEDRAFQAACRRAGAIPVEDLEELVDAAIALAYREPPSGPRMAILTNAGGPSAVGADALDRQGLQLTDLSVETQARLRETCPPGTMTGNPVDMLGGPRPEQFTAALEVLLAAPEVDGVMVVYVPQALTPPHDVAEAVGRAFTSADRVEKPVVCCISGGGGIRDAARVLHANGVPHYLTPARAALGLGALWRYGQVRARPPFEPGPVVGDRVRALKLVQAAAAGGQHVLDPQAGAEVMSAYGLSVPPSGLASHADEAAALAERLGYPVALKRVAPGVVHKSDAGGVALGLVDAAAVRAAFARMIGPGERGFVQQMASSGLEAIVGAQRDAQFGPLVMFGLGGVYVEVLRDVAFRLAPLSAAEAREMVAETAAGRLLAGVRGQPPGDLDGVVDALVGVGQLMADLPLVVEVDLNPLIVGPAGEGAWAVDVRIVIEGTGDC
ncbi:MAG TPA: acetate--CoA ligase family protein [Anaerolineae bacterium]|nr:acetate--CoA ligase family protein [Anaerolineae bacterium]